MNRFDRAIFCLAAALLIVTFLATGARAQSDRISAAVDSSRMTALKGNVHTFARAEHDTGRADPARWLRLITVTLKPSPAQQMALEKLLKDQQDPTSPDYHRWLSPEEYAERFGISQTDVDKITAWMKAGGLAIDDIGRGRTTIVANGTVAQVEALFHTEIHNYRVNGEMHFANSKEPSVPTAIHPLVQGIVGLDDFVPHPARRARPAPKPQQDPSGHRVDFTSGGSHTLAPGDWAAIYDVNALYNAGFDGTGQSIVVAGQTDVNINDMAKFRSEYGLPARAPILRLVPGSADPGTSSNDIGEANLDLEWSGAIAKGATIYFVYSTNVYNSVVYAVNQNLAPVISFSYGSCELQYSGTSFNGTVQQVAQQANVQGITWMVSSDDSGSAGCDAAFSSSATPASHGLSTNIFASIPEVTGVGGTMFNEGSGNFWNSSNSSTGVSATGYIPEVAWNESNSSGIASSGGGLSIFYSRPSWQTGTGINFTQRGVPDIAMTAAGHDCYRTVDSGQDQCWSGTSAAAPSFAGLVAILNQYQVSQGFQSRAGMGNINPTLYRLSQSSGIFHDIVQGNNIVPCRTGSTNCSNGSMGYSAGTGYDLVTGLGSVDANALITRWNGQLTNTTTSVSASPANFSLSASTQLTATIRPVGTAGTVTGSVSFNLGTTSLGTATLSNSAATITVFGSQLQTAGNYTVTAVYAGGTNYGSSSGTVTLSVTLPTANSAVLPSITPNPVYQTTADSDGYNFFYTLKLSEAAGVATTLTGFSINGQDYSSDISGFFTSANIAAHGTVQASLRSQGFTVPGNVVFVFSGVDAGGRTWSQQLSVPFYGAQISASLLLTGEPNVVEQNIRASSNCQWLQNLSLQEENGFAVTLTKFTAGLSSGPTDLSTQIGAYFGATTLPSLGGLQAGICWSNITPGETIIYDVEGTDTNGFPVSATLSTLFQGPSSQPGTLSLGSSNLVFSLTNPGAASTSQTVSINATAGLQWSVSILPTNRASSWLSVYPLSGTGPGTVTVTATRNPPGSAALAAGVYSATLAFQAVNAVPQYINVPVKLGYTGGVAPDQNLNYSLPSTGICSSSFYVAQANLAPGAVSGNYSLIVAVAQGLLSGGFNLGGAFGASGTNPGFGQFKMPSNLGGFPVTIGISAQPLSAGTLNLTATVTQIGSNGVNALITSRSGTPPLNFTTITLLPGQYYTVAVTSNSGSPAGTFQMQMISNLGGVTGSGGFEGGVVAGGYIQPGITGYGGFCVPVSQTVNVVQQGQASGYTAGAINVTMENAAGTIFQPHIIAPTQDSGVARFGPPRPPRTAPAISPEQ